jgi:hypothetical protein
MLTPTELLDKIRDEGCCSTKELKSEDIPSILYLIERDQIIFDEKKSGQFILIEKEQTKK